MTWQRCLQTEECETAHLSILFEAYNSRWQQLIRFLVWNWTVLRFFSAEIGIFDQTIWVVVVRTEFSSNELGFVWFNQWHHWPCKRISKIGQWGLDEGKIHFERIGMQNHMWGMKSAFKARTRRTCWKSGHALFSGARKGLLENSRTGSGFNATMNDDRASVPWCTAQILEVESTKQKARSWDCVFNNAQSNLETSSVICLKIRFRNRYNSSFGTRDVHFSSPNIPKYSNARSLPTAEQ